MAEHGSGVAHLTTLPRAGASDVTASDALVGRYSVGPQLGAGGQGAVYAGHDTLLDQPVAIKLIPVEDAAHRARVRREVASLRALALPGVVRMLDEGARDAKTHFIVMEQVQGRPFPGAPLPAVWEQLEATARALIDTIGRLHLAGYVHRDLKPANVLVDPAGQPTVLDFGLALPAALERVTGEGRAAGTPAYWAPEQALGDRVGPWTDWFSLGVMLFEALSGTRPHARSTFARVHRNAPSLRLVAPQAPAPVVRLVDGLLRREPGRRIQSAAAAYAVLAGEPIPQQGDHERPAWIGSRAAVDALVERLQAGESVRTVGPPGAGHRRTADEAVERLQALGWTVHDLRPGQRPLESLEAVSLRPVLPPSTTAAAALRATRAGLASLGPKAVVRVRDWATVDPWSRRCLEGAGCLILNGPGGREVALAPLSEATLRGLFASPERVFRLRSRAAHLLRARTGGWPGPVFACLARWVAAGWARRAEGRYHLGHEALETLRLGEPHGAQGPPAAPEAPSSHAGWLRWLAADPQGVYPPALAAALGLPAWQVELALSEVVAAGLAVQADGAYAATAAGAVPADEVATAPALHRAMAAVPDLSPTRLLFHLRRSGDTAAHAEHAARLGQQALAQGDLFRAEGLLLEALPGLGTPSVIRAVEALAYVAIRARDPSATDRLLYRMDQRGVIAADARRLLETWLAVRSAHTERAQRQASALPTLSTRYGERARQHVRLAAAWRQPVAVEEALVAELDGWLARWPAEAPVVAGWRGRLLYRQGLYLEAGEAYARSTEGQSDQLLVRAGWQNAASAFMEAGALDRAKRTLAQMPPWDGGPWDPALEGRTAWLARAIRYRSAEALTPDAELVAVVDELRIGELSALVRLTEASVAWRCGEQTLAARWASEAANLWERDGNEWGSLLALSLARRASNQIEDAHDLLALARTCPDSGIRAQVERLLRPGEICGEAGGVRLDVLSHGECADASSGTGLSRV